MTMMMIAIKSLLHSVKCHVVGLPFTTESAALLWPELWCLKVLELNFNGSSSLPAKLGTCVHHCSRMFARSILVIVSTVIIIICRSYVIQDMAKGKFSSIHHLRDLTTYHSSKKYAPLQPTECDCHCLKSLFASCELKCGLNVDQHTHTHTSTHKMPGLKEALPFSISIHK